MKRSKAASDDGDVLGAEGGKGAANGVGLRGGFGGEDRELDYRGCGRGVDEFHGYEDAVVPC